MTRSETVIRTFRTLREAGQAFVLAKRRHAVPTPRQNLMRISLMADVPN